MKTPKIEPVIFRVVPIKRQTKSGVKIDYELMFVFPQTAKNGYVRTYMPHADKPTTRIKRTAYDNTLPLLDGAKIPRIPKKKLRDYVTAYETRYNVKIVERKHFSPAEVKAFGRSNVAGSVAQRLKALK